MAERKCKKQKHILIKHDIAGGVDMIRWNMKALYPLWRELCPRKTHILD
jgi:hypothetical protein